MFKRLNVYESQIEKKGRNSSNLIIEIRLTNSGMEVYVEKHTTLIIDKGCLIIQGADWSRDEAWEIADEAIELSDDKKNLAESVRPKGIGIIHYEGGGFTLVWNCDPKEMDDEDPPANALTLAKA